MILYYFKHPILDGKFMILFKIVSPINFLVRNMVTNIGYDYKLL